MKDKNGKPLLGLTAKDFVLTEDGTEQEIKFFEHQTLQGVLHLLYDDRGISGAGESEFVRGACWVGPLHTPGGERSAP